MLGLLIYLAILVTVLAFALFGVGLVAIANGGRLSEDKRVIGAGKVVFVALLATMAAALVVGALHLISQ